METTPPLIYNLEQQLGLCPELSGCNRCVNVEYIYFIGIVCHARVPNVDVGGLCKSFQEEIGL